jgi:molybdate transport system substrate-binding protein
MRRASALVAMLVAAGACAGQGRDGPSDCADPRTLTVLAAASLTEAFHDIGREFAPECADVRFSFGPSDGLAAQIQAGAPVDVFASASPSWMDAVASDPGVTDRLDFARNRLVVVTPPDDPGEVSSVADLARPGVKLVLAAEGVPAGDYGREILENAGIADAALANVVSNEEDVKGVVQKVILGEADAGIVYVTDITEAVRADLRSVAVPDDLNVVATYSIAVVDGSTEIALGRRFVRFVTAPRSFGVERLHDYGFLPPG